MTAPNPAQGAGHLGAPHNEAAPDVFVARQPIFDTYERVYAYELLFRAGLENYCPQGNLDHAAAHVLENAWLTFGFPTLVGSTRGETSSPTGTSVNPGRSRSATAPCSRRPLPVTGYPYRDP